MEKLRTHRSFAAYFFLSLITLGIYGIVVMSHISSEINTVASKHDGKHTMHYCWILFIFSWLTLGIAPIVWFHRISNRIGNDIRLRGGHSSFGADTFWLWAVVGSLISIGPLVYVYKLLHAMNQLNDLYNQELNQPAAPAAAPAAEPAPAPAPEA